MGIGVRLVGFDQGRLCVGRLWDVPCQCCAVDYDEQFNAEEARRDLLDYRANGPDPSTKRLLDVLVAEGVHGATLLDIGGGIGAVQLELLKAGVSRSVDVDASSAYLAAAEAEADELGWRDRTRYLHGDFTLLASEVEPADVVTLDRVICCYPDARALIGRSAAKARRLYGLVHPVDRWWTRAIARISNLAYRVFRNPYRMYVHRQGLIDTLLEGEGLELMAVRSRRFWRSAVYRRVTPTARTSLPAAVRG
jgi:magnesium-protoporphyrin O-methyltransferase